MITSEEYAGNSGNCRSWGDRHRHRPRAARELVQDVLDPAGVKINGGLSFDIRVLDPAFYSAVLRGGVSGALDAYVEGHWESDRLDELASRVLSVEIGVPESGRLRLLWGKLADKLQNRQSRKRSMHAVRHYELGNDMYKAMLDRRMVYSCGYWRHATNLDAAQEAKLELVARKIDLRPGMRVLDIGCGWGSFARYATETPDVSVVGLTLSRNQYEFGKKLCAGRAVDLRVQDYRQMNDGPFDAIVSIGMLEHVGYKNYRRYMKIARRCLKPDGLFLLQTIGSRKSRASIHPWINRHIFPNAMLPSARQIAAAAEGQLIIEDWHNFGADYDKTLMAWYDNFEAHWPALRWKYGERFHRTWKCYLLTCAGAFRARRTQLWQIVLSTKGVRGGYRAVR